MPRNIKRVAHDLTPLSDAATELSSIISELLNAIAPHIQFDTPKAAECFDECTKASQKLALSIKLIKSYVQEVNTEADREGLIKS